MAKHGDIIFLERRLRDLLEEENYEKAAVVKRWIDELTIFYGEKNEVLKSDLYKNKQR